MPVIRIIYKRFNRRDYFSPCIARSDYTYLVPKLVLCMRLAFAYTPCERFVQAVHFILIVLLLIHCAHDRRMNTKNIPRTNTNATNL